MSFSVSEEKLLSYCLEMKWPGAIALALDLELALALALVIASEIDIASELAIAMAIAMVLVFDMVLMVKVDEVVNAEVCGQLRQLPPRKGKKTFRCFHGCNMVMYTPGPGRPISCSRAGSAATYQMTNIWY